LRTRSGLPPNAERVIPWTGDFDRAWQACVERAKGKKLNAEFHRFHDIRTSYSSLLCGSAGLVAESVIVKRLRGDALRSVAEDDSKHTDIQVPRPAGPVQGADVRHDGKRPPGRPSNDRHCVRG
jgi:hypothetical protein